MASGCCQRSRWNFQSLTGGSVRGTTVISTGRSRRSPLMNAVTVSRIVPEAFAGMS